MLKTELNPLAILLGDWVGEGQGQPGTGRVEISFRPAMRGTFLEEFTHSEYPPQEANPRGEVHEDQGFYSWDKVRKTIVLRQFHVEGFVNQYVMTRVSEDGKEIVFETEAIENIPPGFRARTTYISEGPDQLRTVFELAAPGKDYALYSQNRLQRKA